MSCRRCVQHFQAAQQRLAVDQQVGDEDDHAARVQRLGGPPQDLLDVGLLARLADVHRVDDGVDVRHLAAGRHDLAHVGVERDAADGVLLAQQQVGQAGAGGAAVGVLVERAAAVVHRLADIDDRWQRRLVSASYCLI